MSKILTKKSALFKTLNKNIILYYIYTILLYKKNRNKKYEKIWETLQFRIQFAYTHYQLHPLLYFIKKQNLTYNKISK